MAILIMEMAVTQNARLNQATYVSLCVIQFSLLQFKLYKSQMITFFRSIWVMSLHSKVWNQLA